jgi:hypothetical protein
VSVVRKHRTLILEKVMFGTHFRLGSMRKWRLCFGRKDGVEFYHIYISLDSRFLTDLLTSTEDAAPAHQNIGGCVGGSWLGHLAWSLRRRFFPFPGGGGAELCLG